MGMESMLAGIREELNQYEAKTIAKIRDRAASLRQLSWINSKEVAGPAREEAKDAATYFMMGLSRKLLEGSPNIQAALGTIAVLTNWANIEMLDSLLLMAYLRGAKQALDLTGQTMPAGLQPETTAEPGSMPQTTAGGDEQPCPHCGQIHCPDDELPAGLAAALRDLGDLGKLLGQGPGAMLGGSLAALGRNAGAGPGG